MNGGEWTENLDFNLIYPEYELNPGDVFAWCRSDFSEECDFIESLPFGGDDAVALVYDGTIIDQVGTNGDDPGSGWTVSGVEDATRNHTLVRHPDVLSGDLDWENSAANGWIVYEENVIEYLGFHNFNGQSQNNGDTNADGIVDILDILRVVNYILGNIDFTESEYAAANYNGDELIDILDILQIINHILSE